LSQNSLAYGHWMRRWSMLSSTWPALSSCKMLKYTCVGSR
jgi:hypothetical protein